MGDMCISDEFEPLLIEDQPRVNGAQKALNSITGPGGANDYLGGHLWLKSGPRVPKDAMTELEKCAAPPVNTSTLPAGTAPTCWACAGGEQGGDEANKGKNCTFRHFADTQARLDAITAAVKDPQAEAPAGT